MSAARVRSQAFNAPTPAAQIGDELAVAEAAVKQHLLRLYKKFRISPGAARRGRLANEILQSWGIRLPTELPGGGPPPGT